MKTRNNKKVTARFRASSLIGVLLVILSATCVFSQALSQPRQEKLLNGLKVLMWSDPKADKVTVKLRIHSGSAFDPQGKEGLMQMLSDNLFPNESAREFFTEDLGGSLDVVTNYDYIQINASSKPESFMTMLETVAAAVSNPTIDKETTAKLRTALLTKVAALEADPAYVADQAVAKRLFGTFPYGRPQYGTAESLKKIDFTDLIDAKNRFLDADNATLAISGNFDKSAASKALRRYFGSWQKGDKKIPATFRQPDPPSTEPLQISVPVIKKSFLMAAKFAPARGDKSLYPFMVYGHVISASDCHDYAKYEAYLLRGELTQRMESDAVIQVKGGFCGVMAKTIPEIRLEAFDKAKLETMNALRNQMSTPAAVAERWLDVDTYGLVSPEDELRKASAVTIDDVRAVAASLASSPTAMIIAIPKKSD